MSTTAEMTAITDRKAVLQIGLMGGLVGGVIIWIYLTDQGLLRKRHLSIPKILRDKSSSNPATPIVKANC